MHCLVQIFLLGIITTVGYAEHLKTDQNVILLIFLQGLIVQQCFIVRECRQLH